MKFGRDEGSNYSKPAHAVPEKQHQEGGSHLETFGEGDPTLEPKKVDPVLVSDNHTSDLMILGS